MILEHNPTKKEMHKTYDMQWVNATETERLNNEQVQISDSECIAHTSNGDA